MLANWLYYFPVVLEALWLHLEMTAIFQITEEGHTSEANHNSFGGGHIFATMDHNLLISGWHQCLVGNCVSCWIGNGGKTEELLEMAAVKEGNHTPVADEIVWCVTQMDCLC